MLSKSSASDPPIFFKRAVKIPDDFFCFRYSKIIADRKFKHFDMQYYDFPAEEVLKRWIARGGEGYWQLIEPNDGFHPNLISNAITAEVYLDYLQRDHPDWLGPENPNNAKIQMLFGDQGGY